MNSRKSILLALATGAMLLTASLVAQSSNFAANDSQSGGEVPETTPQAAAKESCKRYRWEHVGHPEKGYSRRVCADKNAEPKPVAETMDHEKKCKKYVREHYGPPGKGLDTVKVVYVECPQKR